MIEVVCGVIGNDRGELLACLRPAGKHLGGRWEFPGGKVDPGETPPQSLARELCEELAIVVEVGDALSPVVWSDGEMAIRLLPYRCRIVGGTLTPLEHERIAWCSRANFHELPWAGADLPVLAEIFSAAG